MQDNEQLLVGLSYAGGFYAKKLRDSKHARQCSGFEDLIISKDSENNQTNEQTFLMEIDCGGLCYPSSGFMEFLRALNGFVTMNWHPTHSKKEVMGLIATYFENEASINYFKRWPGRPCCKDIVLESYAIHKCKISATKLNQDTSSTKQTLRSAIRPMGTRSRK